MHAVIFAGGTLRSGSAVGAALARAELVLAADSGAEIALRFGCTPNIVVGDFDSLTLPLARLEALGCKLVRAAVEKDETDTELAIQTALEHGATSITLLGGIEGARFDHTMANILLLTAFTTPIWIVNGPTTCWLLRGPNTTFIQGRPGDLLSLFPLTIEATGVQTHNLHYPLLQETLHFGRPRGVSNVLTQEQATVALESGLLLLVHTNRQELKE